MTKYVINLLNEPNQKLTVDLTADDGTVFSVDLAFRTLPDGVLCANIDVDGNNERYGVICNNQMPLLADNLLKGNLYFEDLYGNTEPNYEEFNSRYALVYDTEFVL